MTVHENFQTFWNEFSSATPNKYGFLDWQVVSYLHVSDKDYARQNAEGQNELGFQPLMVTLANPFTKETTEHLVKNVTDATAEQFLSMARDRYIKEFGKRFGSFTPSEMHAFAEYDTWDNFYYHWLERDGKQVFSKNVPLLIDHTPKIEYWTRKQSGEDVLPYQRILITTYFVSQKKFYSFFIKEINDSEFERIKLLLQSRVGLHLDDFLAVKHRVAT